MNHHYADILVLTDKLPLWFDEHAVPRFCEFAPSECANIYADEVLLMMIRCQNCKKHFRVCMSSDRGTRLLHEAQWKTPVSSLADSVKAQAIHYGDPPNIECCPAGPTMNSEPERVIEFWERDHSVWQRRSDLELQIDADW